MLLPKMDKALWWGLGSHARTRKLRDMLVDPHQIKGNTGVETEGGTLAKAELRHVGLPLRSAPKRNTKWPARCAQKCYYSFPEKTHTRADLLASNCSSLRDYTAVARSYTWVSVCLFRVGSAWQPRTHRTQREGLSSSSISSQRLSQLQPHGPFASSPQTQNKLRHTDNSLAHKTALCPHRFDFGLMRWPAHPA